MATVGTAALVMITSSAEGGQVPLLIVQRNVLAPAPGPSPCWSDWLAS